MQGKPRPLQNLVDSRWYQVFFLRQQTRLTGQELGKPIRWNLQAPQTRTIVHSFIHIHTCVSSCFSISRWFSVDYSFEALSGCIELDRNLNIWCNLQNLTQLNSGCKTFFLAKPKKPCKNAWPCLGFSVVFLWHLNSSQKSSDVGGPNYPIVEIWRLGNKELWVGEFVKSQSFFSHITCLSYCQLQIMMK